MREPKYRAWFYHSCFRLTGKGPTTKWIGKWLMGDVLTIHLEKLGVRIRPFGRPDKVANMPIGEKCFLMQYTGLRDKQYIEICEGDIVVCREMHDGNVFGRAWTHDDRGLSVACPIIIRKDDEGIDWGWFDDIRLRSEYWEVIGNVYENPELAQEGKA
jgi:hypothetical protein